MTAESHSGEAKESPGGKLKLCVLSIPFSMKDGRLLGRIVKIKYCRAEKVLLEIGWREPSQCSLESEAKISGPQKTQLANLN